jgi:hypothetical protein
VSASTVVPPAARKAGGCRPSPSWPVLVDPSVGSPGPTLPPGHPFLNVQSAEYWSATSFSEVPNYAFAVSFFDGVADLGRNKGIDMQVWCVRGGMIADVY